MLSIGTNNSNSPVDYNATHDGVIEDVPAENTSGPQMSDLPDDITKIIIDYLSFKGLLAFGLTNSKFLGLRTEKILIGLFNEFTSAYQCNEVLMSKAMKCMESSKALECGSEKKIEELRNAILCLCENQSHYNLKNEVLDPYPAFYGDRLVKLLFKQTDANAQTSFVLRAGFANLDDKTAIADEKYALAYLDVLKENLIAPENLLIDGRIDKKLEKALVAAISDNRSIKKIAFLFGNFADSEFAREILSVINKNPCIKEIEIIGSPTNFYDAVCDLSDEMKISFARKRFAKIFEGDVLDIARVIYDVILCHIHIERMYVNAWHPKVVIHLT